MDVRSRLRACEERWRLEVVGRLSGGCRADVFACTRAGGGEVVVKLAVTRWEAQVEAAALAAWEPTGAAVRVFDVDLNLSALLLERVRPGGPLPGGDDAAAVEIAANLLMRLHRAGPGPFPFRTLEEIYPRLEERACEDAGYEQRARGDPARGTVGLARLPAAGAEAQALCATTQRPVLLHGDFLAKNLLSAGTGYVACDPLPRVGDPCADIGLFAAAQPPAATIVGRAGAIAERMGLSQHRARRWAVIWTVHQSCQAWREDQRALDALLVREPGFMV